MIASDSDEAGTCDKLDGVMTLVQQASATGVSWKV